MAVLCMTVYPGPGGCQTGNEHLDQTLLDRWRDLGMRQHFGLCLGEATDARVQAAQARCMAPGAVQ
jgi:hypothetical protein